MILPGNVKLPSELKVHVGDPLAVMVTLPLAVAMSMLLVPLAKGKPPLEITTGSPLAYFTAKVLPGNTRLPTLSKDQV